MKTDHTKRTGGLTALREKPAVSDVAQGHPEDVILSDDHGPLPLETARKIYQQYRHGKSVEALAERFCRTRASIYRIVVEMRPRWITELPLDYMLNDAFPRVRSAKQEREIVGPMPESVESAVTARLPSGLPAYLASLYEVPLLTREQEVHLFRKMNYLKYKASKLREKLDPARPKASLMDEIEALYEEVVATRNQIICANLRLVVSIAKEYVDRKRELFELVSDGNMPLMRAVERFDFARGYKFSTYATKAIQKNFRRTISNEHRHRDRFRTGPAEAVLTATDETSSQWKQEQDQKEWKAQVKKVLPHLDEREQKIIVKRFGLQHDEEPFELKEVGAELGIGKERTRQIEAGALSKLRRAVKKEKIECPD